jgi:hypothetical protein
MYSFQSHKDQRAVTATPIPGYTIVKVYIMVDSTDGINQLIIVRGDCTVM